MKTLYLECHMGAAGDMLMGALLELLPDPDAFLETINSIGLPGVEIQAEPSVKCGITGTHISVKIHGEEEHSEDHHHSDDVHVHAHSHQDTPVPSHSHTHKHHHHCHRGMAEIMEILEHLNVTEEVKKDVKQIYKLIAKAEGQVHGKEVSEIHFHEVGTLDAIADITGCVMLFHQLGAEQIVVSPVSTGFGQVHCAHGILPVPAPATALLLTGIPCKAGSVQGELCTPTGAALLKYFATSYGQMPEMVMEKIGYGMGAKDFQAANCVRAILGEANE